MKPQHSPCQPKNKRQIISAAIRGNWPNNHQRCHGHQQQLTSYQHFLEVHHWLDLETGQ
jgi:hypothetical protein